MPTKKRTYKRNNRGKYLRGSIDEEVDLGTLGAKTLVSALFDEVVEERTLISSIIATHSLAEFTQAVNDGPIHVGVAHSDYTDAEIEEYIENTGSWSPGDKIAQERSKRLIRRIGTFQQVDISLGNSVLNDGKPIKTKLNWMLQTGKTVRLWAYNAGESALATTDPSYEMQGHANLWVK